MDLIVDGKPQGKQRPRFSRISKTVYTPNKTAKYEKQIAKAYTDSGGKCIPADGYVSVTVCAFFPIPKSYTKGKRLACKHNVNRPDKKPDIDNIIKAVLDGLNGVAYEDDKQVVEAIGRKYYTESDGYLWVSVNEVKV